MNTAIALDRRMFAALFSGVAALLMLAGCAPKADESTTSTGGKTSSTETGTSGAATATTDTAQAANNTSFTIEYRAKPDPFKVPYAGALAAENITPGKRGGNFTYCSFGEGPKTLNPITQNDNSSNECVNLTFSSLIGFDLDRQVFVPAMLKEWYMEDDKTHWILKLREGMKWSDGHPITADDIIFTAELIYDPKILNAYKDVMLVDGKPIRFEKVDDLTVRAIIAKPSASFEAIIGFPPVPKHICEGPYRAGNFTQLMNTNTDPASYVCSGPFKFKQFVSGQRVVLERNPNYFRYDSNGTQLPYLDTFIITYAPNQDAMVLRFKTAEVDGIVRMPIASIPDLQDAQQKGNYTVKDVGPGTASDLLWFNLKEGINTTSSRPYVTPYKGKIFRDFRFRRAVMHAIDRPSIIRTELRGQADLGQTVDSPANKIWWNPDLPSYPFDQGKAKALLDEMNLKDRNGDGIREDGEGNKVSFSIITNKGNQRRERCAALISQDLKAVGIEARTDFIDFNALLSQIDETYEYESSILGLTGGSPHPANKMNTFLSSSRTNLYNPKQEKPATPWGAEIDKLCFEINSTLDVSVQKKDYARILQIHAEQLPVLPLWYPRVFVAYSNKFGNVKPAVLDPELIWNADELYVK